LHAGDIGGGEILQDLRRLAPVIAVRGNVDRGMWAENLPDTEVVKVASLHIYMLHDRGSLALDPAAVGFAAVICGHSHMPAQAIHRGVLYFNPGSAGPRRFKLPVSLGRLRIANGGILGEIVTLPG
jgi:putative phosphoesterase